MRLVKSSGGVTCLKFTSEGSTKIISSNDNTGSEIMILIFVMKVRTMIRIGSI